MPDSQPTKNPAAAPTRKQLAYLRTLAERTGQTFTYPRTKAQASGEIRRLRGLKPTPRADVSRERRQISDDLVTRTGDAARIRRSETTGYGSSATWSAS